MTPPNLASISLGIAVRFPSHRLEIIGPDCIDWTQSGYYHYFMWLLFRFVGGELDSTGVKRLQRHAECSATRKIVEIT
jgi:hypothetical protein